MYRIVGIVVIALFEVGCEGEVKLNEQKLDTAGKGYARKGANGIGLCVFAPLREIILRHEDS